MIPIRSCIACKTRRPKFELIRIVSKKDSLDAVVIDILKKDNSRAIYVCNDTNCVDKCIKLIDKNKLVIRSYMNKDNLKKCLLELRDEMGEKSWEK